MMNQDRVDIPRCAGWIVIVLCGCTISWAGEELPRLDRDSAMYLDPEIVIPPYKFAFHDGLKPRWIEALRRPDDELQRLAADAIAKATQLGMQGLEDTADDLVKLVNSDRESATVQYAAVRALVVLQARQACDALAHRLEQGNLQLAQLIEPALASWDYQPIRQRWLERLKDESAPRVQLLLAIEGLRTVGELKAATPLLDVVMDTHHASNVRLAAARAAGQLQPSGLVDTARQLAETPGRQSLVNRLLAGALLLHHDDEAAIAFLKQQTVDEEATVAAQAFECLLELDPKLVFDVAESTIKRPDARLRRLGARALVAKGDLDAIAALAPLLDDENPTNRRYVAASMAEFGKQDDLRESVIQQGEAMLRGEAWRGLEQAILLLTQLDHKPSAERYVELLDFPRGEVYVTAAWALRKLQLPETLPPMLVKAEAQVQRFKTQQISERKEFDFVGQQCAELFQAFGQMKHREADSLLRKCVPKDPATHPETRAAACWALGYLYEGNVDEELARMFEQRIRDLNSFPPEEPLVQRMSANALGRMKAELSLPTLRYYAGYHGRNQPTGRMCYWAIEQITGEPAPQPVQEEQGILGWFLEPIDD
jgi:HEAT repeat protein